MRIGLRMGVERGRHRRMAAQLAADAARDRAKRALGHSEYGESYQRLPTRGDARSEGDIPAAGDESAVEATKRVLNLHLERAVLATIDFAMAAETESFETDELQANVTRFLKRS